MEIGVVILLQVLVFTSVVDYSIAQIVCEGDGLDHIMRNWNFGRHGSGMSIPKNLSCLPDPNITDSAVDPVLEFEPNFPIKSLPKLPDQLDYFNVVPTSVQRKGGNYPHFLKWGAWLIGEKVKNAMTILTGLKVKEDADKTEMDNPTMDGCMIDITKIKAPEPLFLDKYHNLMIPNNGIYRFDYLDVFSVDCGASNVGSTDVTCVGTQNGVKDLFVFNNRIVDASVFTTCRQPFGVETVVRTDGGCYGSGTLKTVGLQGKYGFQKLYEVCYNEVASDSKTLYTVHKIYGQTIYRTMHNSRGGSNFEAIGMPAPFTKNVLDEAYSGRGQQIHKGHLTPWNDQIFQNFRIATNLYINVVPQCNTNNIGNWKQVESLVFALAGARHEEIVVVQGTYTKTDENVVGVDWLPTIAGNSLKIPEYLWKLVKVHDGKEILFVTLNKKNLNLDQIWDIGTFCTSWCALIGLDEFYTLGPRGNNGDVACCTADNVLRRYPDFPLPRELLSVHGSHWVGDTYEH